METRCNLNNHQPEEGHGDQQRAGVGHVISPSVAWTLKQILSFAGSLGHIAIKLHTLQHSSVAGVGYADSLADDSVIGRSPAMGAQNRISTGI
jgi:hypothetical protein